MDKDYILALIKEAKKLKSDIIYINGNCMYGFDLQYTYTKQVFFNNEFNITFLFHQNDIDAVIKNATLITIEHDLLITDIGSASIYNKYEAITINNKLNRFNYALSFCKPTYIEENVRDNFLFEEAITKKTAEGATMFKISSKYIITLYKGLLPVNKSDIVSLTVFDDGKSNMFYVRFNIVKSKKLTIVQHVAYLKMY